MKKPSPITLPHIALASGMAAGLFAAPAQATHFEVEFVDGVFLAVWDGAIDVTVDMVSLDEGEDFSFEDFSFGVVTEEGEVTELLEAPENFDEGHSEDNGADEEEPDEGEAADGNDTERVDVGDAALVSQIGQVLAASGESELGERTVRNRIKTVEGTTDKSIDQFIDAARDELAGSGGDPNSMKSSKIMSGVVRQTCQNAAACPSILKATTGAGLAVAGALEAEVEDIRSGRSEPLPEGGAVQTQSDGTFADVALGVVLELRKNQLVETSTQTQAAINELEQIVDRAALNSGEMPTGSAALEILGAVSAVIDVAAESGAASAQGMKDFVRSTYNAGSASTSGNMISEAGIQKIKSYAETLNAVDKGLRVSGLEAVSEVASKVPDPSALLADPETLSTVINIAQRPALSSGTASGAIPTAPQITGQTSLAGDTTTPVVTDPFQSGGGLETYFFDAELQQWTEVDPFADVEGGAIEIITQRREDFFPSDASAN